MNTIVNKQYCKLTDKKGQTHGGMQWGEGITHTASGEGDLCRPGWIHVYADPLLAVLLNPIHAKFTNPRLWEVEVAGRSKTDNGLKLGFTQVTTICEIPLPKVSVAQAVRFCILCTKEVCEELAWNKWAAAWLSGEGRSEAAAWAAEAAARAARAAAEAAARAAEAAAWAAAMAAEAAAKGTELDLIALAYQAVKEEAEL